MHPGIQIRGSCALWVSKIRESKWLEIQEMNGSIAEELRISFNQQNMQSAHMSIIIALFALYRIDWYEHYPGCRVQYLRATPLLLRILDPLELECLTLIWYTQKNQVRSLKRIQGSSGIHADEDALQVRCCSRGDKQCKQDKLMPVDTGIKGHRGWVHTSFQISWNLPKFQVEFQFHLSHAHFICENNLQGRCGMTIEHSSWSTYRR